MFSFFSISLPRTRPLFPYTTLFRSLDLLAQSEHGDGTLVAAIAIAPPVAEQGDGDGRHERSEGHTSELQSRPHLVCPPPLGKKNRSPPGRHYSLTRARSQTPAQDLT